MATGNSQVSLGISYRISPSSVSKIVRQVLTAIIDCMGQHIATPTEEEWKEISLEFQERWHFPSCVGALDGKHVRIKQPPGSGSQFYNYKNFYSVVLMAMCDARGRFKLFEHGASGSCSDGGVLKNSVLGKKLERGKYKFPAPITLETGETLNPVILGDEGFPLKSYLMKPYTGRALDLPEKIFNYRLSRARMTIEDAFGLLAARWRIYLTTFDGDLELVNLIIRCTILLHNFLIDENDMDGIGYDLDVRNENMRTETVERVLTSVAREGSNNASQDAFRMRDRFRDYFLSAQGEVSWQTERAMRGYE